MKISLNNLGKVSKQEVFEYIVNHLVTQNERSLNKERFCAYRGINNLKCAAGCLIADDEYYPEMEDEAWYEIADDFNVPCDHGYLIDQLQTIHDMHYPFKGWLEKVRVLGEKEGLNVEFIDRLETDMS